MGDKQFESCLSKCSCIFSSLDGCELVMGRMTEIMEDGGCSANAALVVNVQKWQQGNDILFPPLSSALLLTKPGCDSVRENVLHLASVEDG